MRLETELKLKLIDYGPKFSIGNRNFSPDEIITAAGIATIKPVYLHEKLLEVKKRTVENFHRESTRRGHASITTSTNLWLTYEGDRLIDLFVTSQQMGFSAIIFSTRRFKLNKNLAVIPEEVERSKFKKRYEAIIDKQLDIYFQMIDNNISIDQARKILALGFYSSGLLSMSLETAINIIKSVRAEDERFVPDTLLHFCDKLEDVCLEKFPSLYKNKMNLNYNTGYPFPNIFKEPGKYWNFDEEFEKNIAPKIVWYKIDEVDKEVLKNKDWKSLVSGLQDKIVVKTLKFSSIAAFNEEKRHRTVITYVESIFDALRRIKNEKAFYVHPSINGEMRKRFLTVAMDSVKLYRKMVKDGIKPGNAAYIVPHALLVGFTQIFNGYHLLDPFGYFGVRLCTTADEELRAHNWRIVDEIKKINEKLGRLIWPKCKLGYCPEPQPCKLVEKWLDKIRHDRR